MRYLFAFLRKNNIFFLFLFLEIIAIVLMTKNRSFTGSVILNSTSQFSGSLNKSYSGIIDYFDLKKQNEFLVQENAYLKNSIIQINNTQNTIIPPDTIYNYIVAKVISNSIHKADNYLMLDKGKRHGIKIDMPIISDQGIVGSVVAVSENFCSVMSVLHKDSKISAKIKKNNQLANILWDNMDYQRGTLADIPSHIDLRVGDTIITSGHSLIYPEGIIIGIAENYNTRTGSSLNSAVIKFSTDFNSLKYVYAVQNSRLEEMLLLKKEVEND